MTDVKTELNDATIKIKVDNLEIQKELIFKADHITKTESVFKTVTDDLREDNLWGVDQTTLSDLKTTLEDRIKVLEKPPLLARIIMFLFQWSTSKLVKKQLEELKNLKDNLLNPALEKKLNLKFKAPALKIKVVDESRKEGQEPSISPGVGSEDEIQVPEELRDEFAHGGDGSSVDHVEGDEEVVPGAPPMAPPIEGGDGAPDAPPMAPPMAPGMGPAIKVKPDIPLFAGEPEPHGLVKTPGIKAKKEDVLAQITLLNDYKTKMQEALKAPTQLLNEYQRKDKALSELREELKKAKNAVARANKYLPILKAAGPNEVVHIAIVTKVDRDTGKPADVVDTPFYPAVNGRFEGKVVDPKVNRFLLQQRLEADEREAKIVVAALPAKINAQSAELAKLAKTMNGNIPITKFADEIATKQEKIVACDEAITARQRWITESEKPPVEKPKEVKRDVVQKVDVPFEVAVFLRGSDDDFLSKLDVS